MGSFDGEWVKFNVKEGENGQLVAEDLVGLYRPIYIPAKAMTNYAGQKNTSHKGVKWVKNMMRYKMNPERFPEITAAKKKDSLLNPNSLILSKRVKLNSYRNWLLEIFPTIQWKFGTS